MSNINIIWKWKKTNVFTFLELRRFIGRLIKIVFIISCNIHTYIDACIYDYTHRHNIEVIFTTVNINILGKKVHILDFIT